MDYSKFTREELISRVKELEMLNRQLLEEKMSEDRLDFAWTGNLGHWYYNIMTGNVVFNPLKVEAIGFTMDELPENVNYKFFTDRLHPDDHKATMEAMIRNMKGDSEVYECEYRIQARDGSWKWFYDRGRVTQRDKDGKPLFAAGIVFDITEKKEREMMLEHEKKHLEQVSSTDSLTGIRNRGYMMEMLHMRIRQSESMGTSLSVAMFDIDDFKLVNDTRGHIFGDKVLKGVAETISQNIRDVDELGRYGGEEFLLVLPNTDTEKARLVCSRIRSQVENLTFEDGSRITISGGIASYDGEDPEGLIDKADRKLYDAKKKGKNRVEG